MKEESWSFLSEATRKELKMIVSALNVAKDRSELSLFDSSSVILAEIKKRAGLNKDNSYRDFITTIGKAVNCPDAPWNLYEYFLLSTILIKIIKMVDDVSFNLEIAKILNLSNSKTESLCDELMARTRSSEQFRKSLPFYTTSFLGIHWEDAITAHPKFSIPGLLTMVENSKHLISHLSRLFGGGILDAVGMLGMLSTIGIGSILLIKNFFNNSHADLNSILPVVPVLILIKQEHNLSIDSPQEAIAYINDEIRLQKIFENKSHAALSLIIQVANCNPEDKTLIAKYKQKLDSAVLKKKRLPIPPYRLKKLCPYKKDIYLELWKWVEEEYKRNRINIELGDNIFKAIKFDLLGETNPESDSNKGSNCLKINEAKNEKDISTSKTNVVNSRGIITNCSGAVTSPINIDNNSLVINELNEKITELKAQISELKAEKEEFERTFNYMRHDLAMKYATSVEPLYTYIRTHEISEDDVLRAIEVEKEVSSILRSVGRDYGTIGNETYNLSEMINSKLKCETFNFKWDPRTNFETRISIPKIPFETRVLGNIINNLQMHAFPAKHYESVPIKNKIVEACILEYEDSVVLTISNNGLPISETNINHIFEEGACFGETAHTGLGLSYVKKFMEYWKGSVTASIPHNDFSIQFKFTFKKINNEKEV